MRTEEPVRSGCLSQALPLEARLYSTSDAARVADGGDDAKPKYEAVESITAAMQAFFSSEEDRDDASIIQPVDVLACLNSMYDEQRADGARASARGS